MCNYSGKRDASLLKDADDLQHEGRHIVLEVNDFVTKSQRIALVEAMILDRVIPRFDGDADCLEFAFLKLPRRTMNKVMTTAAKLCQVYSQRATLLLKGFERADIA